MGVKLVDCPICGTDGGWYAVRNGRMVWEPCTTCKGNGRVAQNTKEKKEKKETVAKK